ncbi:hypothetical protein [Micromonospora sp. RTGN7]|uniref:hypothetical protein n=1 Tax=Micromonospora sp. RTGN7 TaxID=3016526 RepID=UPI0039B6F6B6
MPAQRPAPAVERLAGQQHGAEADETSARYSSEEPPTSRASRWSDGGIPLSEPPVVQVPPVGMAASGFEVPPRLRASIPGRSVPEPAASTGSPLDWADHPADRNDRPADRADHPADQNNRPADRADRPADWADRPADRADRFPPDVEPRRYPPAGSPAAERPSRPSAGDQVDRFAAGQGPVGQPVHPSDGNRPVDAERPPHPVDAERPPHPVDAERPPHPVEAERPPHPVDAERAGYPPVADDRRAAGERGDERTAQPEPGWAGPDWNRPSWGDGWAPPWSREQGGDPGPRSREEIAPVARRAREDEYPAARRSPGEEDPIGRRFREEESDAALGRSREERAVDWAPEPSRPYQPEAGRRPYEVEPSRPHQVEPSRPHQAEPSRPHQAEVGRPPEGEPTGPPAGDPVRSHLGGLIRPQVGDPVRSHAGEPTGPHAGEPTRPFEGEAGRLHETEPRRPYQPVRAETAQSLRSGAPGPYEFSRPEPRPGPESVTQAAPEPIERPAWAGGGPAPAPPAPGYDEPDTAAVDSAELLAARPFRLRPAPEDTPPAEFPGQPPAPIGAGPTAAPATSGIGRLIRTPSAPVPTSAPPYAARRSAPDPVSPATPVDENRHPDRTLAVLPQRVPAEPDVPVVPEPPAVEPPAETPELARIATHLRRDDEPAPPQERPEGFDVDAILDAVQGVTGVRGAELRRTPAGAHSLRLDLADGADPAEVSRHVARLLQDRMGLAAAPQNLPGIPSILPPAPVRRRSAEPPVDARVPDVRGARVPEGRSPAEASPYRGDRRFESGGEPLRRRRQATAHRGRAAVEESGQLAPAPAGAATGSPATLGASYSGGQMTTTETAPSRPLDTGGVPGPRVVIDHVQVSTFGLDATVEVRLFAGTESAAGLATGPAVDGYLLRLCAVAAAAAVDQLLRGGEQKTDRGRCFVEHTAVVPFGNCEVATVVVLLVCDGWVEQLAGSALVAGDPRQAVVRATLAAVNRRLEALLA